MTVISKRHESFARVFAAVADSVTKWDAPTPLAEWTAGDIVEHLLDWFPGALQSWTGDTVSDVPSRGLAERFRLRSVEIQALLDDRATAEKVIESGDLAGLTLAEAIDRFYNVDLFVHTWDLARAARAAVIHDPAEAAPRHESMLPNSDAMRAPGLFGPVVDTDSTDPVDRLVAFLGRDPHWSPVAEPVTEPVTV